MRGETSSEIYNQVHLPQISPKKDDLDNLEPSQTSKFEVKKYRLKIAPKQVPKVIFTGVFCPFHPCCCVFYCDMCVRR